MSFTPRQHRQNAAFLRALARTGNARAAATALGVHRATYTRHRAKDAAFAARWDAALAFTNAFLSFPREAREGNQRIWWRSSQRSAAGRLPPLTPRAPPPGGSNGPAACSGGAKRRTSPPRPIRIGVSPLSAQPFGRTTCCSTDQTPELSDRQVSASCRESTPVPKFRKVTRLDSRNAELPSNGTTSRGLTCPDSHKATVCPSGDMTGRSW